MNKKIFLVMFFAIMLIGAASAVTYQQNKPINVNVPCFSNGTFCGSAFSCNLTLIDSTGQVIVSNKLMTYQSSFFNYTANPQTNMGRYSQIVSCSDGVTAGFYTDTPEVTADGLPSEPFPKQIILLIGGLILVFLGLLIRKLKLITIVGAILTMVMGVLTLYPGYSYINYSNLSGLTLGTIAIGLGFYFLLHDFMSTDRQEEHPDAY